MLYTDLHNYLDVAYMAINTPVLLSREELKEFILAAEEFRDARAKIGQSIPPTLTRGIAHAKAEAHRRDFPQTKPAL